MIKKIDTIINMAQNTDTILTYTPSITAAQKKLLRVKQAVMKLQATVYNPQQYKVLNGVGEIIDCFEKDKDGYISIDITEEVKNFLLTGATSISLTIKLANSTNIRFWGGNTVTTLYFSKKNFNENVVTKSFDAKQAGQGSVDINTGVFSFTHNDANSSSKVLPISVNHIFTSLLAQQTNSIIPASNCGTGWKLDLQQYLVESKKNLSSDNETSSIFTYIDGNDQHHTFLEKYFYKEDNVKFFVSKENVGINEQGEYYLLNSDNKILTKEIVTESGLTLSNSISSIKGSNLFDTEPEDYISLKQQIYENEKNVDFNTKQIILMAMSKYSLLRQISTEENNTVLNEEYLDLMKKFSVIHDYYLRNYREWGNASNAKAYLGNTNPITKLQIDQVYNYCLNNNNVLINPNTGSEMTAEAAKEVMKRIISESSILYTFGFDTTNFQKGTYKMELLNLVDSQYNYTDEFTIDKIKEFISEAVGFDFSNYDTDNKISYLNKYLTSNNTIKMSFNDLFNVDMQIDVLKQANDEIFENMKKLKMQLKNYEKQLPIHFISNDDGNVLGFAKIPDENYNNIYRLVFISDAYENTIYLNYDDDNKLISIVIPEEKEIAFNYNDDSLLESIIDERNKKITFEYINNLLTKIVYPNKKESIFSYNVDNYLTSATGPNGYGNTYEYTNSQLTKIQEVINSQATNNTTEISYFDFKSTIITNSKTQESITYLFNDAGVPLTVYKNKFENDSIVGNVEAISYDIASPKKKFTIEALANVDNMLTGGSFTGYSQATTSEYYLGDDIYCGDEIFLTAYAQETSSNSNTDIYTLNNTDLTKNKLERVVTSDYLTMINNSDATDYVLSGWAKADSAWVDRRLTDYSDNDVDDNGLENDSINNILKSCADDFKLNRRFELRAEIKYVGIEDPDVQYCSFDWLNTNWQYCAFPVTIRKEPGLVVEEIKVFFDYTNNTNTAEFFGMSLKEGKWEYAEFNDDKLKTYSENSLDKTYTTYEYNEDKKLIKEVTYKNGSPYTTEYQYNNAGSLVRSICGDIVSENVYNDKGSVIKSFTYNKNNPSCKLYSAEEQLDEKGQSNTSVNSFGEVVETSTYSNDTGLLEYTTNENGQVTAYGYDYEDDTLLSTTTTIDGEENHTIYEYEDDLLKSLSHNDFAYSFEHDHFGRIIKTKISDSDYSTTTYEDITETQTINNVATEVVVGERITTTMQPSKEKFVVEKNLEGNIYLAKYINSSNVEFKILENIYDTYGNLVSTKDYSNSQDTPVEYQVFLDKYQNIIKKTYTLHNTAVEISNSETETSKTTTFKLGTNTYTTTQNLSDDLDATLQSVILPSGLTQTVGYDGLKRIHETNLGNIYSKCYNYLQKGDHASNLVASEWFAQNGVYKDSLKYAYDKKGNIVSIKSNGELIASYEYDELSRLTRENNKLLEKTTTFSYDKGGNIIQQKEYTYSTLETQKLSGGESKTYAYRSNGWKDQLMSFNGETFVYDSVGNPTTYRNKTLSWVKGRQLQSFDGKTFAYNASGIRISKTANSVTTNFFLDGTKILAQQSSNGTLVFLHGADGVIGFIHNSTTYYYKKNIQGDIIAILNANGQEIAKYTYDAWGNHKIHYLDGTNFVAINSNVCYNSSDPVNKQIATLNPFRYRGYYFDPETGLYYLNSRYYDPEIGRFINADDIAVLDLTNITINGLNLYAYCLNNPVNEVDENGYIVWWIPIVIAVVATTTIAVGVSIGVQLATTGKINGRQLFFDAIMGALSGLLMFTGLGPLGMALWNGALGFYSSVGSQLISGVKLTEINWTNVLVATILGVVAGSKGAIRNTQNFQKALNTIDDVRYARANRIFLDKETYDKILESNKKKAVKGLVNKALRTSIIISGFSFLNGIIFR